jgi:hypothetical protein
VWEITEGVSNDVKLGRRCNCTVFEGTIQASLAMVKKGYKPTIMGDKSWGRLNFNVK